MFEDFSSETLGIPELTKILSAGKVLFPSLLKHAIGISMGLTKQTDFTDFLNHEFQLRQKKNPKYSLRMFAKFLNMESSRLSKILKKQRPVSPDLIETLGERLGLSSRKISTFKTGTLKPYDKKKSETNQALPVEEHYQLRLDQITLISEWQHYAVLELMKHSQFRANAAWIAEQLAQPTEVIELVINRLQRVGILKIHANGTWEDLSEGYSTHVLGENLTSHAHRNYQAQVLELSKQALFRTDIHHRDHSTIVVATNPEKIQEAKIRIKAFRRQLAEFLENAEDKNEVFHLSISLFPVEKAKYQGVL